MVPSSLLVATVEDDLVGLPRYTWRMVDRILVVDDEPNLRRVLEQQLRQDGHEVTTASSGNQAQRILAETTAQRFSCVISDLRMDDGDGMTLFDWVKHHQAEVPVVFLTAHGSVDIAVDAMRRGAFDFLTKPHDRDELLRIARKAVAVGKVSHRRTKRAPGTDVLDALVGSTEMIADVKRVIQKVANSPTTVLIQGESGTGKELIAEAVHGLSGRSGPLIKVNCSAIPEALFESELFGHEKGAFTGATHRHPGRFELADGGTLFLDEIGDLPMNMQVKLLRVLQERRYERVGGIDVLEVDVRVVAATNANLEEAVRAGNFREDLFYRLNVVPIEIEPLRARATDIPLLIDHFLDLLHDRLERPRVGLSRAALEVLTHYPWPGNVRELENVLERAVLLMDGDTISIDDLPAQMIETPVPPVSDPALSGSGGLKQTVRAHTRQLEYRLIIDALDAEEWNITRAARRLELSRKGLQLKLKELGIERPTNE